MKYLHYRLKNFFLLFLFKWKNNIENINFNNDL